MISRGFSHKFITVISQGPDGQLNTRDFYEVTGTSGGRAGFTGYGRTLEDAIIDAMRTERDTP